MSVIINCRQWTALFRHCFWKDHTQQHRDYRQWSTLFRHFFWKDHTQQHRDYRQWSTLFNCWFRECLQTKGSKICHIWIPRSSVERRIFRHRTYSNERRKFQAWIHYTYKWLGLRCLTPTIFELYRGGQFYWWRKPECQEKTVDLSQVTDKFIA